MQTRDFNWHYINQQLAISLHLTSEFRGGRAAIKPSQFFQEQPFGMALASDSKA
jgi:hypothetical protein